MITQLIRALLFCKKNIYTILLFISVTLCFEKTYIYGFSFFLLVTILEFYRLEKGIISKKFFFEKYFYLLIYSSVFYGSIHITILIILLLFLFFKFKENHIFDFKHEKLFLTFFGLLLVNHGIFSLYFKGLDVYIYFLLLPLLFIIIKQKKLKISILISIRIFIFSILIASILLIIINGFNRNLMISTFTFFPAPLGLTHVYLGLFLGSSNSLILMLNSKKKVFLNIYLDVILFIFNSFLIIYTGSRMSLIGLFIVLLFFLIKTNTNFSSVKRIFLFIFLLLFLSLIIIKIPRVKQGTHKVKELYSNVVHNNKENIIANSWENMYMRYLITSYTFKELKYNWLIGIGMQNVENHISNKIRKDGYKYFPDKMNTHNQYLHFFIGMGVLAFFYFLFMIFYFFQNKSIGIYIISFYIFVMLTESILVRGKGIMLFTFFCLLFLNNKLINDKNCTRS